MFNALEHDNRSEIWCGDFNEHSALEKASTIEVQNSSSIGNVCIPDNIQQNQAH